MMNLAEVRRHEIVRDEMLHAETCHNQLVLEAQGPVRRGAGEQVQQLISQNQLELQQRDQALHALRVSIAV